MGFRCGIVGLPNVGKSTLFNALTETQAAQAANYPFCTIEPNVGIVEDLSDIDTIVGAQAPYDPNNPTQNWKQVQAGQWGWYKWYHGRTSGCQQGQKQG